MDLLPNGLWPVMLTPFDENHEIDFNGLELLTQFYIETGAAGLFTNCLSSEMYQLNATERFTLVKKVIRFVDGRIPIIAVGTFGKEIQHQATFIQKLHDIGVDAVILNTNQYVQPRDSEEELQKQLDQVIALTHPIPLGLYECPVPYRRPLSTPLLKYLAETGRFLYLKETSCNLTELSDKVKAVQDTPLKIFNADTSTALYSLLAGVHGFSNIGMNYFPELYQYLLNGFREGKEKEKGLGKLQSFLSAIDLNFHQYYPFSAKYFLSQRGLNIKTHCRMGEVVLDQKDVLRLKGLMHVYHMLAEDLDISVRKWGTVRQ